MMLASCVSPSTHWPITWSRPNDCKRTPIWWAVKWRFIHYYAQLIYFYLNNRTIVSYSDLFTLDINPFPYWLLLSPHSFAFFFLSCLLDSKVSLSEHDSTFTLFLGRCCRPPRVWNRNLVRSLAEPRGEWWHDPIWVHQSLRLLFVTHTHI